jgi:putative membrane protein insertion efficiency factor
MKKIVLNLIKLYQKTLSRDTGWLSYIHSERTCRFHPNCSQYTYEAIDKFGIIKGGWLGFKRIMRCHPWNKGGVDKIPD